MDEILDYMVNKEWLKDRERIKKMQLLNLVRTNYDANNLSNKIGSILIYNQLIEQFIKDIIEISIYYIKAEIWPAEVELKVDFDNKTFGQTIKLFEQYATKENSRDEILNKLKDFNKKRNEVAHKLFTVDDLKKLDSQLDSYRVLAEKTMVLLLQYYEAVSYKLEDLADRVQFELLYD